MPIATPPIDPDDVRAARLQSVETQVPLMRLGVTIGMSLTVVLTWIETALLETVAPTPPFLTLGVLAMMAWGLALTWVPWLRRWLGVPMVVIAAAMATHTTLYAGYSLQSPELQLVLGQVALGMFCAQLAPDLPTLVGCMVILLAVPFSLERLELIRPILTSQSILWLGTLGAVMIPLGRARLDQRTQYYLALRRVERLAAEDPLTGLWNRRRFLEEAARALDSGVQVAVIYVDVDHFKRINDELGHEGGDRVLQAVGDVLRGLVREDDVVARIGGEEFALLLVGAGPDEAGIVAERVRAGVAGDPGCQATVSVGVATRADDEELDALLRRADNALYEAKRTGRDRVCASA